MTFKFAEASKAGPKRPAPWLTVAFFLLAIAATALQTYTVFLIDYIALIVIAVNIPINITLHAVLYCKFGPQNLSRNELAEHLRLNLFIWGGPVIISPILLWKFLGVFDA